MEYDDSLKSRIEIPLARVVDGTFPKGSEWARNPIPACNFCNIADCEPGGPPNSPAYIEQQKCTQFCAGGAQIESHLFNITICPINADGVPLTQFKEPIPELSSYVWLFDAAIQNWGFAFSIVDRVLIPADLDLGDYLLSWRWDTEGTHQVWQNFCRCQTR